MSEVRCSICNDRGYIPFKGKIKNCSCFSRNRLINYFSQVQAFYCAIKPKKFEYDEDVQFLFSSKEEFKFVLYDLLRKRFPCKYLYLNFAAFMDVAFSKDGESLRSISRENDFLILSLDSVNKSALSKMGMSLQDFIFYSKSLKKKILIYSSLDRRSLSSIMGKEFVINLLSTLVVVSKFPKLDPTEEVIHKKRNKSQLDFISQGTRESKDAPDSSIMDLFRDKRSSEKKQSDREVKNMTSLEDLNRMMGKGRSNPSMRVS